MNIFMCGYLNFLALHGLKGLWTLQPQDNHYVAIKGAAQASLWAVASDSLRLN